MSGFQRRRTQLEKLPAGELQGATRLDLAGDLTELPDEVYELADTLEVLNVSGNSLTGFPDKFASFKKLRILFCSGNPFTTVPEVLGECESLSMVGFKACDITTVSASALPAKLQWLILTDNKINTLPAGLGDCQLLQKCMLAGNQLSSLPDEMRACINLELLRLSANRFETLPPWLLELPKLSWLAFSGNPLNHVAETTAAINSSLDQIVWDQLNIEQPLGEGASGVIYRASLDKPKADRQKVAVKVFKGSVTSDGLPGSEMAAFAAAGNHDHLTNVEGVLCDHPQHAEGIVMSLIDDRFKTLAQPPDFNTCTRDVYAADQSMSFEHVVRLALGVASAVAQLHEKGLMHGDLYAHNILHDCQGDCILSDFGGASFLPDDQPQALAMQRVEVRAFSCLLEELLRLCDKAGTTDPMTELYALQRDCAVGTVSDRPLFREIVEKLKKIQCT